MLHLLAHRFVRGDLRDDALGGFELERRDGAPFAIHAWLDEPVPFEAAAWTAELGESIELPRLVPTDPAPIRFTPTDGLVIVEVERGRIVAVHAWRFAANSLAGAITSEANLMALFDFVTGPDFTRESAQRYVGPIQNEGDWRCELQPRPGANVRRATLETSKGVVNGLVLEFETELALDLRVFQARFGEGREMINGNPPSFHTTYSFGGPGGYIILGTYGRTFTDVIVRRQGDGPGSIETTRPKARRAPAAPFGPDRVASLVHAFFERGVDEAGARDLLGAPTQTRAGRTRLAPHDPDLVGVVLRFAADHAAIEIELAESAALEPALLESELGAAREIPPLHAYASPAHRFHVRNAQYCGYVLVARDRVVLHRIPATGWLGDFVRAEELVSMIQRFVTDPALTADAVYPMLGHAGREIDIGHGQLSVDVVPYAGSNARETRVCHYTADRTIARIELALSVPRELDLRHISPDFAGPNPNLLGMSIVQHSAYHPTGAVLVNTADRRPGPVQAVESFILDRSMGTRSRRS